MITESPTHKITKKKKHFFIYSFDQSALKVIRAGEVTAADCALNTENSNSECLAHVLSGAKLYK